MGFEPWSIPRFPPSNELHQECDADVANEIKSVEQMLVWYELDLGLNHVVRKHADTLDSPANCLISVPGGKSIDYLIN